MRTSSELEQARRADRRLGIPRHPCDACGEMFPDFREVALLPCAPLTQDRIADAANAKLWFTTHANGSMSARRRSACRRAASCTGVASGSATRITR